LPAARPIVVDVLDALRCRHLMKRAGSFHILGGADRNAEGVDLLTASTNAPL
jgi:hypothetical protein